MSIIRVFDFEATSLDATGDVIEAGTCDLDLATMSVRSPYWQLFGTDCIPPETRAVHHITMAEVAGKDRFDPISFEAAAVEAGAVAMVAHNVKYEGQWFAPRIPLICTYKAALRVWPDAPTHSNQGLRYWLEDQGLLSLNDGLASPPHRAGPDAYVTAHILKALLATGVTGKTMTGWTKLPAVQPVCKVNKHKGKPWPEVPLDYLQWIVHKSDLDDDTKWNAQIEIERRRQ